MHVCFRPVHSSIRSPMAKPNHTSSRQGQGQEPPARGASCTRAQHDNPPPGGGLIHQDRSQSAQWTLCWIRRTLPPRAFPSSARAIRCSMPGCSPRNTVEKMWLMLRQTAPPALLCAAASELLRAIPQARGAGCRANAGSGGAALATCLQNSRPHHPGPRYRQAAISHTHDQLQAPHTPCSNTTAMQAPVGPTQRKGTRAAHGGNGGVRRQRAGAGGAEQAIRARSHGRNAERDLDLFQEELVVGQPCARPARHGRQQIHPHVLELPECKGRACSERKSASANPAPPPHRHCRAALCTPGSARTRQSKTEDWRRASTRVRLAGTAPALGRGDRACVPGSYCPR